MNRSVDEHPWTQQNRARIGFAVFPLSAPLEPLSGSMRNRKSPGHARFSGDSPASTKTDGLAVARGSRSGLIAPRLTAEAIFGAGSMRHSFFLIAPAFCSPPRKLLVHPGLGAR